MACCISIASIEIDVTAGKKGIPDSECGWPNLSTCKR